MVTFSFIIPVYNVAPYLNGCMDSVLAQTFADWEAICIDDGSVDGSGEMLDRYAAHDSRIRVVRQANAGVSSARNAGIDLATGEYLVFLDGDDAFVPWALEFLSSRIAVTGKPDILMFRHQSICRHEDPLPARKSSPMTNTFDLHRKSGARKAFYGFVGVLLAWNGIYRRESVGNLRFATYPNGEDVLFGAQMLYRSSVVVSCDDVLYRYVQRTGSAARVYTTRHLKSTLECAISHFESISTWCWRREVWDLWRRKIRTYICGGALSVLLQIKESDRTEAWRMFFDTCEKMAEMRAVSGLDCVAWWCVAKMRSRVACMMLMRVPWKFRALVGRVKLLRRVRASLSKV